MFYVCNFSKLYFMEKKLFVIDGYRIWAYTYEDALVHYTMILKL
jgi:hypothetical protein